MVRPRVVADVRRRFGPVDGLQGTPGGLAVGSPDGRWLLGVTIAGSSAVVLFGIGLTLVAVAVLPVLVGISGKGFYEPAKMATGFHVAMTICGALAAAGGVLAWFTISGSPISSPGPADQERSLGDRFSCPIGEPNACSGPTSTTETSP